MITCNYKLTSYADLLRVMAPLLGSSVHDDQFELKEPVGNGFFRTIRVNDDIEVMLYDFTLRDMLVLRREPSEYEYYTLILDELELEHSFELKIAEVETSNNIERSTVFYLTSYLYDIETVLHKNANAKGIRMLFSADWMRKYLQLDQNEGVIEKYLDLKSAGIWYKPVTAEITALLHDLVNRPDMPLLFYQSKIYRIIEQFFEWLYDEMKMISSKSGISRHDVEMAQKIEGRLTADVTKLPPTLKELAREVAMSESKLKKIFKSVYGLPPYEYFQRQRMHQARLMLLSGNYSVKDIGYTLGYANLSNFTLAFKKIFNKLPSQVLPPKNS